MSLPIVGLLLAAVVSLLTQLLKYLSGKAGMDWSAEVAQIAAALIATLGVLAKDFLPIYLQPFVGMLLNSLGAPLSAALLAAGALVIHDLVGIVQGILAGLPKGKK
jgi:hypothetical protein